VAKKGETWARDFRVNPGCLPENQVRKQDLPRIRQHRLNLIRDLRAEAKITNNSATSTQDKFY
jgi:hypothetical protein